MRSRSDSVAYPRGEGRALAQSQPSRKPRERDGLRKKEVAKIESALAFRRQTRCCLPLSSGERRLSFARAASTRPLAAVTPGKSLRTASAAFASASKRDAKRCGHGAVKKRVAIERGKPRERHCSKLIRVRRMQAVADRLQRRVTERGWRVIGAYESGSRRGAQRGRANASK